MDNYPILQTKEWYHNLIEDCKTIITEAVFTSRWALVEGYWNIGKRIREDENWKKYSKGAYSSLTDLSKNIGVGERDIYRSLQFYDKYPSLDKVPEGKNITWNKIITKYLPENKNSQQTDETCNHKDTEIIVYCKGCGKRAYVGEGDKYKDLLDS